MIKNQHVVPRAYLKNFENENGKVYAFNLLSKKTNELSIEKVCAHNYTYELSKKEVDNSLEKEISKLESNYMPAIHEIIRNVEHGRKDKLYIDNKSCFMFLLLQYIRSDSGRVLMGRALKSLKPMDHHLDLNELNELDYYNWLFKTLFKNKGSLETYLNNQYKCKRPVIKVGISRQRNFLTSDNPVINIYMDEEKSGLYKLVLPISPNICIYFVSFSENEFIQDKCYTKPYEVNEELAIKYNQSVVNVANYWVVSKNKFDVIDYILIFNRRTR